MTRRMFTQPWTSQYLGGWRPGQHAIYSEFGLRSLFIVRVEEWPENMGDRFGTLIDGPFYLPPVMHDRSMGSVRAEVVDTSLVDWDFAWYGRPLEPWKVVGTVHYYHYENLYRSIFHLIRKEERTTYPEVQSRIVGDLMGHPGWERLRQYGLRGPDPLPPSTRRTQPVGPPDPDRAVRGNLRYCPKDGQLLRPLSATSQDLYCRYGHIWQWVRHGVKEDFVEQD